MRRTPLADRRADVLRLLAAGKPAKAIYREPGIDEGTAKTPIATIVRGLDLVNRAEAATVARAKGLLQ